MSNIWLITGAGRGMGVDIAKAASGWLGFYWGESADELRLSKSPEDQTTLQWLELFQRLSPNH